MIVDPTLVFPDQHQESTVATADYTADTAGSTRQGTVGTDGDDPTAASKDCSTLKAVEEYASHKSRETSPKSRAGGSTVNSKSKAERHAGHNARGGGSTVASTIASTVQSSRKKGVAGSVSSKAKGYLPLPNKMSVSWADSLETDQPGGSRQSADSSLIKAVGRGVVQGTESNIANCEQPMEPSRLTARQPPIAMVQPPSKSLLRHSSANARAAAQQQQLQRQQQLQQQQQQQARYFNQSGMPANNNGGNGTAKNNGGGGDDASQPFGMSLKRFLPPLCAVGMPSLISPSESALGSPPGVNNPGAFVNNQAGSSAHNGPNAGLNAGEIPAGEPNLPCFSFPSFSRYILTRLRWLFSSKPFSRHLRPELEGYGDRHGAQGTTSPNPKLANLTVGRVKCLRPPYPVPTAAKAGEHATSLPADKS